MRTVARVDGLVPYEWGRQERVRPFVAGPDLPRWIVAIRLFVLPVAMLAAIVTTAFLPSFVGWAAAALAVPVLSVVQLGVLGWRDRRSRPTYDAVVEPLRTVGVGVGVGVGVTRRFRAKARVAVTGSEIVFVDGVGAEQWHPLTGPSAVNRCELLVEREGEAPVAARFRTADGRAVAVLAAHHWWDEAAAWTGRSTAPGADPVAALRHLARTAGIELVQRRVAMRRDRVTGRATPVGDWVSGGGVLLAPVDWRTAHRLLGGRRGMPDPREDGYALGIALFVLILPVAAAPSERLVALVLSSLTVVVWFGVHGFRRTARRFWSDRAGWRRRNC